LIGFFIVDIKSKTKVHAHGARGDD
jgi:hypothetical protein